MRPLRGLIERIVVSGPIDTDAEGSAADSSDVCSVLKAAGPAKRFAAASVLASSSDSLRSALDASSSVIRSLNCAIFSRFVGGYKALLRLNEIGTQAPDCVLELADGLFRLGQSFLSPTEFMP